MDAEKQEVSRNCNISKEVDEEEDVPLPGFRFHPTDEELVGFYLRRKVEKKPISIELIKQIDIYKYDPWDLPKGSNGGEKEWYFFCKRGRKYRNSIRPNRVTGSGFWKATGIDRPIYSTAGSVCIGLKKSLVYYRGCAGKGTKTDWMMHEFRLPPSSDTHINTNNIKHMDDKSLAQEAEVWTLCRILKRNTCHKKTFPDWKEVSAKRNPVVDTSSKTCSGDSEHDMQSYISFQGPMNIQQSHERKPFELNHQQEQQRHHVTNGTNQLIIGQMTSMSTSQLAPSTTVSCSSFSNDLDMNEFIKHGDWDDLRSVVEFAAAAAVDPVFFM